LIADGAGKCAYRELRLADPWHEDAQHAGRDKGSHTLERILMPVRAAR
jgi:hypothetical protein